MPELGELSAGVTFRGSWKSDDIVRRPVRATNGFHVDFVAWPTPCPTYQRNIIGGLQRRTCRVVPKPAHSNYLEFKAFCSEFIRLNFPQLDADADLSFSTWINNTNYSLKRRSALADLRKSYEDGEWSVFEHKSLLVKCFIKDEPYVAYKYPRGIYSRSDNYKVVFGPIVKAIESVVYEMPYFIKHVPSDQRASFVHSLFGDVVGELSNDSGHSFRIVGSDYTSFEAHLTPQMFEIEFMVYDWVCANLPNYVSELRPLFCQLARKNFCVFKYVNAIIPGTRMSGEMNTSLGNGVLNLLVWKFMAHKFNLSNDVCLVEGDDLIATYVGPKLSAGQYESIGFLCKLDYFSDVCEASFCGQVFDSASYRTICDPIKVLLNFGWVGAKYLNASGKTMAELARARAMSLLCQYPGCPILESFSRYVLRMTPGKYRLSADESLYRVRLLQDMFSNCNWRMRKSVNWSSRLLMMKVFKVDVLDQIELEKYFDSLSSTAPIVHPAIYSYVENVHFEYYNKYVMGHIGRENVMSLTLSQVHLKFLTKLYEFQKRNAEEGQK